MTLNEIAETFSEEFLSALSSIYGVRAVQYFEEKHLRPKWDLWQLAKAGTIPIPPCPVAERAMRKIGGRATFGFAKYRKTLARTDLSKKQWRTHLQEELMDAVGYIEADEYHEERTKRKKKKKK